MLPKSQSILTPAQWRVLERLVRGESNVEIARGLGLVSGTVKVYLTATYRRLDLGRATDKRAAAAAWYRRVGHRYHESVR